MAESEEELKSLLMKVKVESEKVGLNLNIQKTKIMASGPITSWEIDGETMETVSNFIFLFLKFYSFLFLNFIFKLYNIVLVLPNIKMNPPQVYLCSPSWTLLPPPSPYHPSGSPQCTSPKHPGSCIKPGLATRSIYDIIHISMPFSQTSHPLPLPQSPKDCSIHQGLFCCLVYRLIVTIFLNSIYMH